jgi:multiple sugar transport system ATP-binding protein
VAGFIGSPAMNMVTGRLIRSHGDLIVGFGEHRLAIDEELIAERPALRAYEGRDVVLGIRPEDFEDAAFASEAPTERTLDTVCTLREALGSEVLLHFPIAPTAGAGAPVADASSTFVARVHPQTTAREGDRLRLVVNTKRLHFFEPEDGFAIDGDSDQSGSRVLQSVGEIR